MKFSYASIFLLADADYLILPGKRSEKDLPEEYEGELVRLVVLPKKVADLKEVDDFLRDILDEL